jgi:hypothetical protein
MAPRVQVDTQLGRVAGRPTSSPVDQFVQVNPNGGAAQLARALQDFAPEVRKIGLQQADIRAEDSKKEGAALAQRLSLQKKTFEQAVKEGLIPRGANPFFFAGVKEQFGRVQAGNFASDLRAQISLDDNMRTTTNIADYDKFVQNATEKWLGDKVPANQRDEFFDAGFNAIALAAVANQREQFAAELMSRVEKLGDEALYADVAHRLTNMKPGGRADLVTGVQSLMEDLIKNQGRNGTQVVRTVARAIAETAGEKRSFEMLDALKELRGKDGLLADTEYGKKLYKDARKEIVDAIRQDRIEQHQVQEIEREDRTRGVLSEAVTMLGKNPQASMKKLIADNSDLPEVVGALRGLRENMGNMTFENDENVLGDLTSRIWVPNGRAVTPKEIASHVNNGLTAQTAATLFSMLDQRAREAGSDENDPIHKALRDIGYLDEKTTLRDRLAGILSKDMVNGGQRLSNAEARLAIQWLNYLDKDGKDKGWSERRKWLNGVAADIVKVEAAAMQVHVDPKGAAFPSESAKNAPPAPKITRAEAIRMGQELRSNSLSRATQDYLKQTGMDQAALKASVTSALTYYNSTK